MEPWFYTTNQFGNCTDNSYLKAVKIAQKHDSFLFADKADPFILALYNFFHPFYVEVNSKYDILKQQEGGREGSTLNMRQKLRLQSNPKVRLWDKAIQQVYDEGTPQYKSLLPDGRAPFQTGPQISRINAVNTLSLSIGSDAALATLKTELDAWYNELDTDFKEHEGDNNDISKASENMELARVAMCNAMYKNMADLMGKYYTNPQLIEKYFPLDLIRNAQQVDFTNSVAPQKIRFIVKRTLSPDHEITLINDGNTELWFYLAPNKTTQPGAIKVIVAQLSQQTVAVSALGNPADAHFLAYNPETEQAGHFTLELV